MTIGELNTVISAYVDKMKTENESKQQLIYTVSALTASFVARAFNGKDIPTYESIFKPEVEANNQVVLFREQMKQFARQANKRRQ